METKIEAKVKSKIKTEKETDEDVVTTYSLLFEGKNGNSVTLKTDSENTFNSYPRGSEVTITIKTPQTKLKTS